jgi:hypothetical protein
MIWRCVPPLISHLSLPLLAALAGTSAVASLRGSFSTSGAISGILCRSVSNSLLPSPALVFVSPSLFFLASICSCELVDQFFLLLACQVGEISAFEQSTLNQSHDFILDAWLRNAEERSKAGLVFQRHRLILLGGGGILPRRCPSSLSWLILVVEVQSNMAALGRRSRTPRTSTGSAAVAPLSFGSFTRSCSGNSCFPQTLGHNVVHNPLVLLLLASPPSPS